jgi:hypothetical protein
MMNGIRAKEQVYSPYLRNLVGPRFPVRQGQHPVWFYLKAANGHKTNILLAISAIGSAGIRRSGRELNYFFVLEVINDEFCDLRLI